MIEVETPALLLYRDVMERNLEHMADRAKKLGVALRPHIKTHKCLELGRRQQAYGAKGITVATLFEAQAFARDGFGDLTWAFPLDPTHVPHVHRIAQDGVTLRVILDDLDTAQAMAAVKSLTGVTEARPGNYIFYDRTMVLIGCCEPQDVAVSVLATVVSHQPGAAHFVVDAGALSLSKDAGPAHLGLETAFGEVKGHPELTVASVSQEHGLIRAAAPAAIEGKFKVGQQVEIIPNHSCLTEAHFDEYVVIEGGRVMDRWHIERGR